MGYKRYIDPIIEKLTEAVERKQAVDLLVNGVETPNLYITEILTGDVISPQGRLIVDEPVAVRTKSTNKAHWAQSWEQVIRIDRIDAVIYSTNR